jgi:hypothetical protein
VKECTDHSRRNPLEFQGCNLCGFPPGANLRSACKRTRELRFASTGEGQARAHRSSGGAKAVRARHISCIEERVAFAQRVEESRVLRESAGWTLRD